MVVGGVNLGNIRDLKVLSSKSSLLIDSSDYAFVNTNFEFNKYSNRSHPKLDVTMGGADKPIVAKLVIIASNLTKGAGFFELIPDRRYALMKTARHSHWWEIYDLQVIYYWTSFIMHSSESLLYNMTTQKLAK